VHARFSAFQRVKFRIALLKVDMCDLAASSEDFSVGWLAFSDWRGAADRHVVDLGNGNVTFMVAFISRSTLTACFTIATTVQDPSINTLQPSVS